MTLRNICLNLEIGQEILVGPNNDRAKITKIEFHEKREMMVTTENIQEEKIIRFINNWL